MTDELTAKSKIEIWYREQTYGYQFGEEGGGMGWVGRLGLTYIYSTMYKTVINKNLPYCTGTLPTTLWWPKYRNLKKYEKIWRKS